MASLGWVNHFEKDRFPGDQTSKSFVNAPAGMMFPAMMVIPGTE
jgi:hypothetical protein